jgi:hypothetical protein
MPGLNFPVFSKTESE